MINMTLITACSSTRQIPPLVKVEDMPTGLSMQQAVEWWVNRLNSDEFQDKMVTPREQYRGVGFMTLAKILMLPGFKFDPYIVTGGQGLIGLDELIVPYDFTASRKEDHNIHQKVTAESFVQTVWWEKINTARKDIRNPVAFIHQRNSPNFTLIALPKLFLRYISDNILEMKNLDKVRILLSASSIGSVPQQLRPWIIPYERSSVAHIPGNRNDNTHRAALFFLQHVQSLEDPEKFLSLSALEMTQIFGGVGRAATGKSKVSSDHITAFLEHNPYLLKGSCEDAYVMARRELGAFGGRMFFSGIFRKMSGHVIDSNISEAEHNKALAALSGFNFVQAANSSEEEALRGIKIFANAVKSLMPLAQFTSADITKWASNYYGEGKIPDLLSSPNKMTHILSANYELLGLEAINGGKAYKLLP